MGIKLTEKIKLMIPIFLVGTPKGVKEGGILEHLLREVEVEGLPLEIPEHLEFDVSELDIGDVIHVRDLQPPPGVAFLHDSEAPLVTIHPPVAAAAAEVAEEVEAPAEPEVIGARPEAGGPAEGDKEG